MVPQIFNRREKKYANAAESRVPVASDSTAKEELTAIHTKNRRSQSHKNPLGATETPPKSRALIG